MSFVVSCDELFLAHINAPCASMHTHILQNGWNGQNVGSELDLSEENGVGLELTRAPAWNGERERGAVMYCGGERGTVVMRTLPHPSTIRDKASSWSWESGHSHTAKLPSIQDSGGLEGRLLHAKYVGGDKPLRSRQGQTLEI